MEKEEFLPVDLVHLRDRALSIKDTLERSQDLDRSANFKNVCLKKAIDISDVLLRDFYYYFDTKTIGGRIPMGLDEVNDNYSLKKK